MVARVLLSILLAIGPQGLGGKAGAGGKAGFGGGVSAVTQSAFVQVNSCVASSTCAFNSNVAAGNALHVVAYDGGGSGLSLTFTDSQGNSIATTATASLAVDEDTESVGCGIAGSSAGDTVTVNVGGNPFPLSRTIIFEVSGSTCTVDHIASQNVSSGPPTSCNSTAVTTSANNDFMISICGIDNITSTFTVGSGWSHLREADSTHANNPLAAEIITGTNIAGSFTGTMAYNSSAEYAAIIVAYLPP